MVETVLASAATAGNGSYAGMGVGASAMIGTFSGVVKAAFVA